MNTVELLTHFFLSTGAAWVLWLLGALSVASIALCIERALFYRQRKTNIATLAQQLDAVLAQNNQEQAIALLETSGATAARIACGGLKLSHLGAQSAKRAMQSAFALERSLLENRLAFLGTLGNNAPFIGLFGTVIGVIQAFEALGHASPGHASSTVGEVASQAVMSSIAEALVATAVGIAVALPAVAAYNYFQRTVASLLSGSEVLSNLVLAHLSRGRSPCLPEEK